MSATEKGRFGGALEAALDKMVETAAPIISVADAGTREAFLDAWARTLSDHARHLRSKSKTLKAPAVVAYVPDTRQFVQGKEWERRSMLRASHTCDFAGMLAVGTGEIAGYVHPEQLPDTKEFERAIRSVGLESAPTIGLMSESTLVVWPDGIDGKAIERSLDDKTVIIDRTKIDNELDLFYTLFARQATKWWQDTQLRTTVRNPEAAVQQDLWIFLLARNSNAAWIRVEEVIGNGRADITIVPIPKHATGETAVLELKTLRDVRTPRIGGATPIKMSQKKNIVWAVRGVQQAAGYREHHKMDVAFLCLYDFCAGNSSAVYDEVTTHASRYEVIHRRYWITASNEEHREDQYPIP